MNDLTDTPLPGVVMIGRISKFGGPDDMGVRPSEPLALIYPDMLSDESVSKFFLPVQPPGTTGLARRLDTRTFYCAMRWKYLATPRPLLRQSIVRIFRTDNIDLFVDVSPVDWGPGIDTGRMIDVSDAALLALDLLTPALHDCQTDSLVKAVLLTPNLQ